MNELWLALGFFGFVMAAITAAGYYILSRPAQDIATDQGTAVVLPEMAPAEGFGIIVRVFQLVGRSIPSASSDENPLRKRLIQAGYRLPSAVHIFYGVKCASSLAFSIVAVWAADANDSNVLIPLLAAAVFGYRLPDLVLQKVIRSRGARLRRALPAALDMLVLAVEAGQSIDQALVATCRGLKSNSPDLASELTMLHLESRATNNRAEALRNFAARNKEPELKKLSSLLIDTDRFGTSVGPALRDHAKYLRIRSRQQAQEAARKVGVKLIFPVFFLIFPSVVLVTLGPAVILIFTQLNGLLR